MLRPPVLPLEMPPDSGVRVTYVEPAPLPERKPPPVPTPESLSFQVYTVDQLARRAERRPATTKLALDAPPAPWRAALGSVLALAGASLRWLVSGRKSGASARAALSGPYAVMKAHVRAFVRATDWKRIGFGLGLGLTTVALLVFVVVTVAELTDDLKPASKRSVHLATATLASPPLRAPAAEVAAPAPTQAPTVAVQSAPVVAPAIAPAPARAPARPTKIGARRDADEVFTP